MTYEEMADRLEAVVATLKECGPIPTNLSDAEREEARLLLDGLAADAAEILSEVKGDG